MFRNFNSSGSDSDSDSSVSSIEDNHVQNAPSAYLQDVNKFDVERRIVRSEKDKRYEEFQKQYDAFNNCKRNKDYRQCIVVLEEMGKIYNKSKKLIEKEGKIPEPFLFFLIDIEQFVKTNYQIKSNRIKLEKLRSRIRPYISEFRLNMDEVKEDYENSLKKEQEEDDGDESETSSSETDSDNDDKESVDVPKQKTLSATGKLSDAEDDSSNLISSDDEFDNSDLDTDDTDNDLAYNRRPQQGKAYRDLFIKATPSNDQPKVDRKRRKEAPKPSTKIDEEESEKEMGDVSKVDEETGLQGEASSSKYMIFAPDHDITVKGVLEKLNEIVWITRGGSAGLVSDIKRTISGLTGKKSMKLWLHQLDIMRELRSISLKHLKNRAIDIKILYNLCSLHLDYMQFNRGAICMDLKIFQTLVTDSHELLKLLANSPEVIMNESIKMEEEEFEKVPNKIVGSPISLVENLDDEYYRIMQVADQHSADYIDKLSKEVFLYRNIDLCSNMAMSPNENNHYSLNEKRRIVIKFNSHIYYRVMQTNYKCSIVYNKDLSDEEHEENIRILWKRFLDNCKFIYQCENINDGNFAMVTYDRYKSMTILHHVYALSIHDKYFEARDLLLMSHIQDTITQSDPLTMILYNRTLVQLGMAAFRAGYMNVTHQTLADLLNTPRTRALLAQGVSSMKDEDSERKEKLERARMYPFHQHINIELPEYMYLISCLLTEVPFNAAHEKQESQIKRRFQISRQFYSWLKQADKVGYSGPPDSTRDHITAAYKLMKVGDWKNVIDILFDTRMYNRLWSLVPKFPEVKERLVIKIKEECLRTYLIINNHLYLTISIEKLAKQFELEEGQVRKILCQMICNEEFPASIEDNTNCVTIHQNSTARDVEKNGIALSERINGLTEVCSRLLEAKISSTNYNSSGNYNKDKSKHKHTNRMNKMNRLNAM
ncbi:hypothetical protein SNEBB_003394 [Seison nebaliae]|nr:hypothetical protein SNEBB_003394 [Seison nebaliae]